MTCRSSSVWEINDQLWIFLLVDPVLLGRGPGSQLLGLEPKSNFLVGRLDGVRPVTDVAANMDGVVTTDCPRERSGGVGLAQHHASGLDSVQTLPHHSAHGTAGHVGDQAAEEALARKVSVVLLQVLHRGRLQLHGHQLETLLLETSDDLANKSTP